jgi:hypothetical protein
VPVVAVEELLGQLAVLGDELGVRVGGIGEADQGGDADPELGRRLGDELRVAVVPAHEQEVRLRRLHLGELRREVGRAQAIGHALHQFVAGRLRERLDVIVHGRAEVAVLVHDGHALDGQIGGLRHLDHFVYGERAHGAAVGLHPER